ncbi:MAG TPA: aminotransferase class III-fold pyridoxal phosphate-dependent enzyme [Streptosporangiaceae bacterium]|jgi:4-aminobutyrate aminotransferase-like enzyme|nr:aminotransferase class III-fold pyridoxal phosphate-dependent enzyme [Streptosporangiaceae bacterium]
MVKRPDPLESTPPAFDEKDARQILREGFGVESSSLKPLAGERDQNFRVDTADGQSYLFKISNPADDEPILAMQAAALRHIERVDPGLPVMRVLPAPAGESWLEVPGPGSRIYPARLFTFLPGRVTANTVLSTEAIRSHGQITARLGRALRGFFHPAADYEILWNIAQFPKIRPLLTHVSDRQRRAQVERIMDRFEARVAPVLPRLRAQVIHGDMSLDNVLFDDDLLVSGIVDFGDMTHAPLICDLAVEVADVLHGRDDAIEAAGAIIGGYVSVTPLEDEEAGLLADLVAARLATEVTITAWRRGLYPDNTAYAASGEPGARAFLDAIEAVGIDAVGRRFREACRPLPYHRSATGDLLERRRRALPRSPLFYSQPVHLVRGEGVWLFDPDDRRYLDCYNNVAVVGHSHPRVVDAVTQQQRLLATHSRYLHEAIVELAERLKATLPPELDAVVVVNSGSEANDLAWRIARAATGRAGAVVTACAYHGLTEATHALSPEEWAKGEQPAHVATIPAPDGYRGPYRREDEAWAQRYAAHIDDAARALGDRGFAALYLDPALTADGILSPPPEYLREAARRARRLGALMVADEVQAGHGRSGTHRWSFQASGITPDIVVMGKPMGGGFPVAALVVRSQLLAAVPEEVELFSTFGGNPVACAAALAVLAVIEDEGLLANAAKVGSYLRQGLLALAERHSLIGDVRGEGLLLGVELVDEAGGPAAGNARNVTEAMRERGVLLSATGPAGNVLKIRPPLVFQREHADLLLQALDEVLASP